MYAAKFISLTNFLDILEHNILPNANTPTFLYTAVFWYVSRGLSDRPYKLYPATWGLVQSKWDEVYLRFPESQVEGTREWLYMTSVKEAMMAFEADSAVADEPSCLVPFQELEDEGLVEVCDTIIQHAQSF